MNDAEPVVLALCGTLLGGDGHGAGLLSRRHDGRFHTARCPIGMYLRETDRLTNGSPCSDRCEQARTAIRQAGAWLREHEHETQMPLLEVVG